MIKNWLKAENFYLQEVDVAVYNVYYWNYFNFRNEDVDTLLTLSRLDSNSNESNFA